MKLKNLLKLILILAVVTGCGGTDSKTNLEFSLEVGNNYGIQITKQTKNIEEINGELTDLSQKLVVSYSFTPIKIAADGMVSLEGTILALEIHQDGSSAGIIDYNSVLDTVEIPLLAKPYANMIGKKFNIDVMKDGTVKKVEGMKQNIESAFQDFEIKEEDILLSLREKLNDQFCDEVLYETFERMLAFYPTTSVEIGDEWNKKVSFTNQVPLILRNSYKLMERNNGVAVIAISSEIETDTNKIIASKGKFPPQKLVGSQHGKMQIDEISGWISRAIFEYQLHDAEQDPSTNAASNKNKIISSEIKVTYEPLPGDVFKEIAFDPSAIIKGDGLGMTLIGMLVVYGSLVLLYFVFANLSAVLKFVSKKKTVETLPAEKEKKEENLTGELNAAISMALYLYSEEIHDEENTVLTIKKVARTYSPWSSKIYGLRQYPR